MSDKLKFWAFFLGSVIAMILLAWNARAHEWYPSSCCNDRDCRPVAVENVLVSDGEYIVLLGGQKIYFADANPSPDGDYHICTRQGRDDTEIVNLTQSWPKYKDGVMPTSSICFWAPGGM